MKKIEPIEEIVEEVQPIPKFSIIDGDGPARDINWLENLPVFTVFFAREKRKFDPTTGRYTKGSFELREYHVVNKFKNTTKLKIKVPGSPSVVLPVDTNGFSLSMELVEVIYNPNE